MTEKYLFVCSKNKFRSPYAAKWLSNYFKENNIDSDVRSAGLWVINLFEATRLTQEHIDWADTIFVMEAIMKEEISSRHEVDISKIINLNIPDIFSWAIEESRLPYDDNVSPFEAVKILEKGYREYGFEKHFGTKFYYKVLKGKLENIIK